MLNTGFNALALLRIGFARGSGLFMLIAEMGLIGLADWAVSALTQRNNS